MGTGRDGDSKENIQGPQSNFLLGSGTGFSRGRERRQAWRSEATELELHPDIGQPSLEGWSKRSYPEPLKRLAYLESEKDNRPSAHAKKRMEECSEHRGMAAPSSGARLAPFVNIRLGDVWEHSRSIPNMDH